MAIVDERLAALERAITRLAANRIDTVDLTVINNLNIQRYTDLHTAYVNLSTDIEALALWCWRIGKSNN